jgi:hypothetical protein
MIQQTLKYIYHNPLLTIVHRNEDVFLWPYYSLPNYIIPYSREHSVSKILTSSPEIGYCNDHGKIKGNKPYENANIGVAVSKVISVLLILNK